MLSLVPACVVARGGSLVSVVVCVGSRPICGKMSQSVALVQSWESLAKGEKVASREAVKVPI